MKDFILHCKINQQNWLITGGCGFIGLALINTLLEKSHLKKIRVLDNLSVGTEKNLSAVCEKKAENCTSSKRIPVELMIGDIKDLSVCKKACEEMDVVVHLAANTGVGPSVEDPFADMQNNVIGTLNMLEAARYRKLKKFIFASSGAPVGEVVPPIHEELAPKPVSPYGASKLSGEGYCSAYYRSFGLKTIVLRFGNVYGPGSVHKHSAVAKFIKRALEKKPIIIYGDGQQTRDFIFIDDLVNAILCSASVEVGGEIFQIAMNQETSVIKLADLLKKIIEDVCPEITVNITFTEQRLGDVKRNYSDTSKAKNILRWDPFWSLEKGLYTTVNWFIEKSEKEYKSNR
jgi:UDP-glucose 4-epimerase